VYVRCECSLCVREMRVLCAREMRVFALCAREMRVFALCAREMRVLCAREMRVFALCAREMREHSRYKQGLLSNACSMQSDCTLCARGGGLGSRPKKMYGDVQSHSARGGGLGSSTIFKKFNEPYAPS